MLQENTFGQPVFLCSGQGSQRPGMGSALKGIKEVELVFECASDIFGFDVFALTQNASLEQLNQTQNAQVALVSMSLGLGRALEARGVTPSSVLGFSLGQISALGLAGMLGDEALFQLLKKRACLMSSASQSRPGAMCALLNADEESANSVCALSRGTDILEVGNYNCPGQIVISGSIAAIGRAEEAWAQAGKRFVRLPSTGGFHSPLMTQAAEEFISYLEGVSFENPYIPVICNVDATALTPQNVRSHLALHLTHPVFFHQSVEYLVREGADCFVEVGYGSVLCNLVKRINRGVSRLNVQDKESLEACIALQGVASVE